MMLLTLFVITQVGAVDNVIDPRIDTAKYLLSHLGVTGPLRLESASPAPTGSAGPDWVVLHDAAGNLYHSYFVQKERLPYGMYRGEERDDFPTFPLSAFHDRETERLAWRWVKLVRGSNVVRLEGIDEDKYHRARATFGLTDHGYPFLHGFTWFGYSFVINSKTKAFMAYSATVKLPKWVYHPPRFSESQAVAAAQHEFDTVIAPRALKEHGWHLTIQFRKPNVLGFNVLPGESVAHLMWSLPYTTEGETGAFTKRAIGGAMIVDAVTGRVFDLDHSTGTTVDRVIKHSSSVAVTNG